MAPTIHPEASMAGMSGSGEGMDGSLVVEATATATAEQIQTPSWALNCTSLLDTSVNVTALGMPGNHTEAYALCLQRGIAGRVSNSTSDFLLRSSSSVSNSSAGAFMTAATTTATVDAFQPPGLGASPTMLPAHVSDWVELLATRKDLLRICIQSMILIAIFLASVLANSFVFVVFYRKPTLLSNSYRFVLNLAVCNCLMTVLVMPFVLVSTFTHQWILGWGSCEAIGMLAILLFVASILTLMLIAMDRYHAIMKPLHYHLTIINQRPGLCIAGVWLVSLLIAIPPLLGLNHFSYQPGKAMCTVTWRSAEPADRAYSFSFVLLCFVIPYFVMLWVYVCAFRTAQRTTARARRNSVTPEHAASATDIQGISQKLMQNRDRRRSSAASLIHNTTRRRSSSSITRALLSLHRDDWKAAKTSLIVMSAFTVCWLPFFILITMEAIVGPALEEYGWATSADGVGADAGSLVIPYWLESGTICLALAGCALNPIVYVFRSEKIKHEIRKLFCPGGGGSSSSGGASVSTHEQRGLRYGGGDVSENKETSGQFRPGSILISSRRESLGPGGGPPPRATTTTTSSSVRLSQCSSSGSLINSSTIHQAARITGAAATMVVTFNEDGKHRDGVCL